MAKHHFIPQIFHHSLGLHEPVLHIKDGDIVTTSTLDARGSDSNNVKTADRGNPVIGPFYVEDAEPGDTVAITFNSITPNRDSGFTGAVLSPNVVEANLIKQLPVKDR